MKISIKSLCSGIAAISILIGAMLSCTEKTTSPEQIQYVPVAFTDSGMVDIDSELLLNSPASITVAARGSHDITFNWFFADKNKKPTMVGSATINANDGPSIIVNTHTIDSLTTGRLGSYFCVVSNKDGNYTHFDTSKTIVIDRPIFSVNDTIQTKGFPFADSSFALYCNKVLGADPLRYIWMKDTVVFDTLSNDTLRFSKLTREHSGVYYCIVYNNLGIDTSVVCSLNVFQHPQITSLKSEGNSVAGQDFKVICNFTGTQPMVCSWYKNDELIDSRKIASRATQDTITDTLVFSPITDTSAGEYHFIVHNEAGSDTSCSYKLRVYRKPFIQDLTPDGNMFVDSSYEISVQVFGSSPMKFLWFKDNDNTPIDNDTIVTVEDAGQFTKIFRIHSVQKSDAGIYSCVVRNTWGSDTIASPMLSTINRAPLWKDTIHVAVMENTPVTVDLKEHCIDPDKDVLTFSFKTPDQAPDNDSLSSDGIYRFTPGSSESSDPYIISFQAKDSELSSTGIMLLKVKKSNYPPKISIEPYKNNETVRITEMKKCQFKVSVSDPDNHDTPVLLAVQNSPSGAFYDTVSGNFEYTPPFTVSSKQSNHTFHNVTLRATDGTAETSFVLHILVADSNDTPTAADISEGLEEETQKAINIIAHDSDGDALVWKVLKQPQYGTVTVLTNAIDVQNPEFSYKADNCTKTVTDTMTVEVSDGIAHVTASIFMTITADNDIPAVTAVSIDTVTEDDPNGVVFDISALDPENQPLTWQVKKQGVKGTVKILNSAVGGHFEGSYTPSSNSVGTDEFVIVVCDGKNTSAAYTVPVVIKQINDPPTVSIVSPYNGQSVPFAPSIEIKTEFNDPEGWKKVEFFVDGVKQDTYSGKENAYTFNWKQEFGTHSIDKHTITAVITDNMDIADTAQIQILVAGSFYSDTCAIRMILDKNGIPGNINTLITKNIHGRVISLTLNNKNLTTLLPIIRNVTELKVLNLANNKMKSIPDEVGTLINLEEVRLDNNVLESLTDSIGALINLKRLTMNSNNLTALPETIGRLQKLELFKADNCKLNSLPSTFGNLTSLKELYLNNDSLKSFPPQITSLTNLITLEMNNNVFDGNSNIVPNDIENLKVLKTLKMNNTGLGETNALAKVTSLETLELKENNFTNVVTISNLSNLKTLNLSSNKYQLKPNEIDVIIKSNLNLEYLYLSNSQLQSISAKIDTLSKLKKLDISSNKALNTLPPSLYKIQTLDNITIRGCSVNNGSLSIEPGNISELNHITYFNVHYNKMDPATLDTNIVKWLDKVCPSENGKTWKQTQGQEVPSPFLREMSFKNEE